MNSDRGILSKFLRAAREARAFFGNKGLERRERTIVHGLLNVLGITHGPEEIMRPGHEPIDVQFREARFQIVSVVDTNRRIGDELKERERRIENATKLSDLLEPVALESRPIGQAELIALVVDSARPKAAKYGRECAKLDLLVAVILKSRHSFDQARYPAVPELAKWRSVSVVLEGFGVVLWAGTEAPAFLRERLSQPFTKFEGGTIFDLK